MKINMFKLYKLDIICGLILGLIILIGSIILIRDDCYILLFIYILLSFFIALFPIALNYKHLTYVLLNNNKCTSYSLLRKKLCEVNFKERVFYSEFYIRFLYTPPIKFIALSNEPFICKPYPNSIFEKGFYGAYNQKEIIIFPYDNQVATFLNFNEWYKIN